MSGQAEAYDVAIIGGGVSGTALLYILARYTNLRRIILFEKHVGLGLVNSAANNNSQTLHVGDIETNYSMDKVRQVKPASMMVARYAQGLEPQQRDAIISPTHKMILAVGTKEVLELEKRFTGLKAIFPQLQKLSGSQIATIEPAVMEGRDPQESVLALFNPDGFAVNFGKLAESFAEQSRKNNDKVIEIVLGEGVTTITKSLNGMYQLITAGRTIMARAVVVDADAYSLGFAKQLGYGQHFSLIPIAGTFYFSAEKLRGKVYTMQEARLPFAAVHGDPDMTVAHKTRWGPTAEFVPVLESRGVRTALDYFRSSGLERPRTWKSFFVILSEPVRFWYLLKNILYILPVVGKYFFVSNVQKIVPTLRGRDLQAAKGFGGMRLQRVDVETSELQLGEGKIIGDNIIFNMTPSPGASVCLYNALRDTEQLLVFLNNTFTFDKQRLLSELSLPEDRIETADVSLKQSYSS